MISLGTILKHYKREDIQQEMVIHAEGRELAVRFNDNFGKRPDILKYPADIMEFAKSGATSFHVSEERWSDPLLLRPEMRKKELDELRIGWDLVLDVDCKDWEYSRIITHLIIQSLKDHKVGSISCKFSGNKGFHVGVPFEAFPDTLYDTDIKNRFPDDTRIISNYLVDYIGRKYGKKLTAVFEKTPISDVAKKLDVKSEELRFSACVKCGRKKKSGKKLDVIRCVYCGVKNDIKDNSKYFQCKHCRKLIKIEGSVDRCDCGSTVFEERWNIPLILGVDAILISSRHMYRMPYSLHEKSGLVSVPISPDKVLSFERDMAEPSKVKAENVFLDRNVKRNDAKHLFEEAFKWHTKAVKEKGILRGAFGSEQKKRVFEIPQSGVDEEHFPPCIKKILEGVSDGRKRALFTLTNFLNCVGWGYDKIEERLAEWNEKNDEQLREVSIKGQVRYHKQRNQKVLPPNCANKMYYSDMQVCNPDTLCSKIRNPVNYALRKVQYSGKKKFKKKEDNKKRDEK